MSLDLNNMVNTSMNVLTKPSTASFESAKSSVNTVSTIAALAVAGAVAGFLGPLAGLRMSMDNPLMLVMSMCGGFIFGAILFPIFFYIGMAILWVIAKALGGTGGLEMQANLVATFAAPLSIAISVLNIIPFIGGLLGLVVAIYELYLLTLALTVTHQYSMTKAVVTWLIPALVAFVLAFCVAVVFGVALASMFMGGLGQ